MMDEHENNRTDADQERPENNELDRLRNDFEYICASEKNLHDTGLMSQFLTHVRHHLPDDNNDDLQDFINKVTYSISKEISSQITAYTSGAREESISIAEKVAICKKQIFEGIVYYGGYDKNKPLMQALGFDEHGKYHDVEFSNEICTVLSADTNEWMKEDEERAENDELTDLRNDFEDICASEENLRNKELVRGFLTKIWGHLSDENKGILDSCEDFVNDLVTRLYQQIDFQKSVGPSSVNSGNFSNSEEAAIFKNMLYRETDRSLHQALGIVELHTKKQA